MSKIFLSSILCAICLPLVGITNFPESIKLAEAYMQQKKYPDVIKILKDSLPADFKEYALLLKALAYFKNNDKESALVICKEAMQIKGESPWSYKLKFLAAEIFISSRQYKEAELIYREEAARLLSENRKEEIAEIYIKFAETLSYIPKPEELDKPQPDYNRAYNFYNEVLKLGVSDALQEKVLFRMAGLKENNKKWGEAIKDYIHYLEVFDPDWQRQTTLDGSGKNIAFKGSKLHIYEARLNLGEMYIKQSDFNKARIVFANLIDICKDNKQYHRLALRRIPATYKLPNPGNNFDLENGVEAVQNLLSRYPDDSIAPTLTWYIILSYINFNQTDKAITALQDYIRQNNFTILKIESAEEKILREKLGISNTPAGQYESYQMEAYYKLGELLFRQKNYPAAISHFTQYISKFPNGPQWTAAQQGIINAEYQEGLDLIAGKKYREGEQKWESFLVKHPLDMRSRQIMFTLAQIQYEEAKELKKKSRTEAANQFQKAIAGFKKLISKYPNTEESSLAQFRVGEIQETELEDLESALQSFRTLTWGSYYSPAQTRVSQMVNKELVVKTERIFRTTEKALVKIKARNIEKVKINIYELNLEAYFRKAHCITGIEKLDLALIQPDKNWEAAIDKYKPYLPLEQEIEIPINGAGVFAVNIAGEDLEATTLVIRSDIDLIVKSSKKECLVFVEDTVSTRPVNNARLIFTDGNKVLAEGATGSDGVLAKKLPELVSAGSVNVFAVYNRSVAATGLNINSLGFSKGLIPRGYIFSDKPAYRPGETVNLRGIIRDVKEGSYAVPVTGGREKDFFSLKVLDAAGKILYQDKLTLSEFGTFTRDTVLSAGAMHGTYTILVENQEQKLTFNGSFTVADYKLEKIRLTLNFNQELYFRSEVIKAVFKAEYYFGQPVTDHEIVYRTPDGLQGKGRTDKEGMLALNFDTTPFNPGTMLAFYGSLPGENVEIRKPVLLAAQGFYITMTPNRDVALQGEAVEIRLNTNDAAGKPVSKALELTVLKRMIREEDSLLNALPWMQTGNTDAGTYAEKTITAKQIITDDKGSARFIYTPEESGEFIIRAGGRDSFNTVISAETSFFISGKDDKTKLRFFAAKQHYKVGENDSIVLHSRIESRALVLITFEGEDILSYQVKEIKPDKNIINLNIEHAHFPNFVVSAAVMDKNSFYTASIPFTVERELKINLVTGKHIFEPGEKTEIELSVFDHLGKPVIAELSLSLVNEALLAQYSDPIGNIVQFFQQGAYREAKMLTETSCTFAYFPETIAVIKEIQEELDRLLTETYSMKEYAEESIEEEYAYDQNREDKPLKSKKKAEMPYVQRSTDKFDDLLSNMEISVDRAEKPEPAKGREELPEAGYWIGSVITDAKGKAKLTLLVPALTGAFRLSLKGCTPDTLVGETERSVTVRKDFFASLKVPAIVQEGDQVRFTGRVHNLTGYRGAVSASLVLLVNGKTIDLPAKNMEIGAEETKEFLFDNYTIPLADKIRLTLEVKAGTRYADKISTELPVRPWGLPYTTGSSGVSENNTTLLLKLPGNLNYLSRSLKIIIQPDVDDSIIQLVLEDNPPLSYGQKEYYCFPEPPSTRLLAALYVLKHLVAGRNREIYYGKLTNKIRGLISELVSTQNNLGAWNWELAATEYGITASAYWALVSAEKQGFTVDKNIIAGAMHYLKDKYSALAQDDNETKALLLYALSLTGDADFSFVNRLHRNRNQLSDAALAFTALCLGNMDKKDLGREVLEVATSRLTVKKSETGDGIYWSGSENNAWYKNPVETTALLLLAYQEILPGSGEIAKGINFLISEKREFGFYPEKVTGLAVSALAKYYGQSLVQHNNYAVEVICNDKKLGALTSKNNQVPVPLVIEVPDDAINSGDNRVEFKHSGSGKYFFTAELTGFTSSLVDPKSWTYPAFNYKKYIHEPLTYRGKVVGESSMEIGQLEFNQVTTVKIDFSSGSRNSFLVLEEYIPSGTVVLMDTIKGTHNKVSLDGGKLTFFFEPKKYISSVSYSLAAYLPGEYKILPPVIRDPLKPADMRMGKENSLKILAPGASSTEEYIMNESELFGFGKATFEDGNYSESLKYLEKLYAGDPEKHQPDTARMLLWIRTEPEYFNANRVVEYFEILKEKYPALSIPFAKILTVGNAYHSIGEFERAYLVYRATIEASFYKDTTVGGYLEKNGEFIGSVEYINSLLNEYPDLNAVISTLFSIAQEVYNKSGEKQTYSSISLFGNTLKPDKYTPATLLSLSENMLNNFITLYPEHKLVDEAAFSMLNISLDQKEYNKTILQCRKYQDTYKESEFFTKYQYMEALAYFSLRKYEEALKIAEVVANGGSENKSLATYILGQIYHARRQPANAIEYYNRIKEQFTDAGEAINYFEKKSIFIPEVNIFTPEEKISVKLEYRNIKEVFFQIYKVDLMKLYLREKNLSKITKINLAGISPFLEKSLVLGDGKDYGDKEKNISLEIAEEGAYLIVCRGDDLFTSGLVLITPLTVEVQEDIQSGRIRVNIFDKIRGFYPDNVHIKAIGSDNTQFVSGNTDLRGIFVADGITGYPTVIARNKENQYAFYRGKVLVGSIEQKQSIQPDMPMEQADFDAKYRGNLFEEQKMIQQQNRANLDFLYKQDIKGVEVQSAK